MTFLLLSEYLPSCSGILKYSVTSFIILPKLYLLTLRNNMNPADYILPLSLYLKIEVSLHNVE